MKSRTESPYCRLLDLYCLCFSFTSSYISCCTPLPFASNSHHPSMPLSPAQERERASNRQQNPSYVVQQHDHQQHCINGVQRQLLPWWQQLRLHPLAAITPPTWSYTCPHCSAVLLSVEAPSVCCQNRQHALPWLPSWPTEMQNLLRSPASAMVLSSHNRVINNAFSFAGIGASGKFIDFSSTTAPPTIAITGRTYHYLHDADTPAHSIHWFLYNEQA